MKFVKCPVRTCEAKIVIRSDVNETFAVMLKHLKKHNLEELEECFLCWLLDYLKRQVKE